MPHPNDLLETSRTLSQWGTLQNATPKWLLLETSCTLLSIGYLNNDTPMWLLLLTSCTLSQHWQPYTRTHPRLAGSKLYTQSLQVDLDGEYNSDENNMDKILQAFTNIFPPAN